jgi:hypothetical protein
MGIGRKLEEIHQDLTRLAGQGMAVGFLTNTENAERINGLVEDIREVMMDYQVCMSNYIHSITSDIHTRLHYNRISTTRAAGSL